MTRFSCKVYGKGSTFLPKEVRESLTSSENEFLLFHSGKAAVIIPKTKNIDIDQIVTSVQACLDEIKIFLLEEAGDKDGRE